MKEIYNVTIRGVAPLLQHRFDTEKKPKEMTKGKIEYDDMVDAQKCLYKDEKGNICQPALHIENAMIKAASDFNMAGKGKKTYKDAFKGGIFCEPTLIQHKYQEWQLDRQNVVIQRARIVRARPRLDKWELDFKIINIDERLTASIVKQVLTEAGQTKGLGDYRPRFGRFEVVKFETVKKAK